MALTNKCNRCHGCWSKRRGSYYLPEDELDLIIENGKAANAHYYTLLGGEPMMYPAVDVFQKHSECYFRCNGMMFTERNAERIRQVGNVTPSSASTGSRRITINAAEWGPRSGGRGDGG